MCNKKLKVGLFQKKLKVRLFKKKTVKKKKGGQKPYALLVTLESPLIWELFP